MSIAMSKNFCLQKVPKFQGKNFLRFLGDFKESTKQKKEKQENYSDLYTDQHISSQYF